MRTKLMMSVLAAVAVSALTAPAQAQQQFKVGVVMSLSGGFVAAAKDTMDGLEAWEKARRPAGQEDRLREARRRNQSGERLERLSPPRRR